MGRDLKRGTWNGTIGSSQLTFENRVYEAQVENSEKQITIQNVKSVKSKKDNLLKGVTNLKVVNAINQLYRKTAVIGDGGSADALRFEVDTGHKLSGNGHLQKVKEMIIHLEKIMESEELTENEKQKVEALKEDLENAIKYYNERNNKNEK